MKYILGVAIMGIGVLLFDKLFDWLAENFLD